MFRRRRSVVEEETFANRLFFLVLRDHQTGAINFPVLIESLREEPLGIMQSDLSVRLK